MSQPRGIVLPCRVLIKSSVFLLFVGAPAAAQTFALSSATGPASGTAVMSLTLSTSSAAPTALQWTMQFPAASVLGLNVTPGAAAAGAGKSISCVPASGSYTCVLYGPNATTIPAGTVAVISLALTSSTSSFSVGLTKTQGADSSGGTVAVNGTGATVTVSAAVPTVLKSLACTPSTLLIGTSGSCVVSLANPAAASVTVALRSSILALALPSQATIPAGSSSTTFLIQAGGSTGQTAVLTATLNGASVVTSVNTTSSTSTTLQSLTCTPSSLLVGTSGMCTLSLANPAPSNLTISLSASSPALLFSPLTVVVAGATSSQFTISATGTTAQTVILTATYGGASEVASINVTPASAVLQSLSCPLSLPAGTSGSCTLSTSVPVAAATSVTVRSNLLSLKAPASVTIPAGASSVTFTISGSGTQTMTGILTATLSGVSVTATVTVTVTMTAALSSRVNAGGPAFIDSAGNVWEADTGFNGGSTAAFGRVRRTASSELYQSSRFGNFLYDFEAPSGAYTVNLKFAEPVADGPGQRVFDVLINDAPALTNFDIFAQAGGSNLAVDRSLTTTVTDGHIRITFREHSAAPPLVSGIEILPVAEAPEGSPPTDPQSIRINVAGSVFTDAAGLEWSADSGFSGGTAYEATAASEAPAIYQKARYGESTYRIPAPDGKYIVTLKFAEIGFSSAGMRRFQVALNGTVVLPDFDIFSAAGGARIPVDRSFVTDAVNGLIEIDLRTGAASSPLLSGIEVIPMDQQQAPSRGLNDVDSRR